MSYRIKLVRPNWFFRKLLYDFTEDGRPSKWAYSIGLAAFFSLSIEIGDGISKKQNGFSYEDFISGLLGIGMGAVLEALPVVDNFIGLSAEYYPTKYLRRHPGKFFHDFLEDYSGWKFMANLKLAGFRYIGLPVPDFTKYIMIDVGYNTKGFTPFDDPWAHHLGIASHSHRQRDIFIGFSLNMMEVVKDFFDDANSFACRATQQPFKYYHIPAGVKNGVRL